MKRPRFPTPATIGDPSAHDRPPVRPGRLTDEQRRFRATSEDELLTAIAQWADLRGWQIHHDRRSDRAIQQGDRGFPDLVLARHPRVIFAELKSETGQLTREQMAWVLAIAGQKPAERLPGYPQVFVWRPSDLDRALKELE